MKKTLLLAAALLFVSTFGYAKSVAPVEIDWAALSVKAWDETFYKLVPEPSEGGNAFGCLMHATGGMFAQESTIAKQPGYEWWDKLYTSLDKDPDDEQKAYIEKGIKIPELEHLVDSSNKRGYAWVGIFAAPSTEPMVSLMEIPFPRFVDVNKLHFLLVMRAMDKLKKGDKAGGEADLMASLRVGHTMQKDTLLIGFMFGTALEIKSAKMAAKFYKESGNDEKAKAWDEFAKTAEVRRDKAKAALKGLSYISLKQAAAVTDNADLPRAFRIEAMSISVLIDIMNRKSSVFGLSDEVKNFITAKHFDDPELLILQFKLIEDVYAGVLTKASTRILMERIYKE